MGFDDSDDDDDSSYKKASKSPVKKPGIKHECISLNKI